MNTVRYPFRRNTCVLCGRCVWVCGQMKPGEEGLCGKCESQLSMAQNAPESCVQCELGKGFFCTRATP